jgi:hypothetical protein
MVLHRPVELAAVTGKVGTGTKMSANPTTVSGQSLSHRNLERSVGSNRNASELRATAVVFDIQRQTVGSSMPVKPKIPSRD